MKVLMINGSPHTKGCIHTAFTLAARELADAGIETEEIMVGNKPIRGCIACMKCKTTGKCVFDDLVNETAPKLKESDGLLVGTPVYYGAPNGNVLSFMQRLFYSCGHDLRMKVGASVVSCRRGGNSATFQVMNQFFGIAGMPTVPSTYWNDVHGYSEADVLADAEGCETIRNLGRNMAFLMKAIQAGKETLGMPDSKKSARVNFIRGDLSP